VTAIGYVLTALSGKYLLNETISQGQWLGILLITSGVILVGLTAPVTTTERASE
jgi:drug/metabolite transporter (DMT)-like permease